VVTPEGLPLAYEVLPGNTADNSDGRIVPVSPDCRVRFQPATGSEITRRSNDGRPGGQDQQGHRDRGFHRRLQPAHLPRHAGQWGPGRYWSSQHGCPGIAGLMRSGSNNELPPASTDRNARYMQKGTATGKHRSATLAGMACRHFRNPSRSNRYGDDYSSPGKRNRIRHRSVPSEDANR
jgi:hypothetical protein